ncbi:hypothetical protein LWI28_028943 [Acer negundo]|uniref:Uncharacterized protein n=1 Tax=Acer negundo TaxID=4023 RepID=A0AAD5J2Y6_ACENE|nr:hypothetical protein LWI28_028943 [Acer negundo]KAK4847865.1 hypothetical protein QYF36_006679 [Acer negundo]
MRGALASKSFDFGNDDKNNVGDFSSESVLNYVKVMDLATFLEKLLASEASNVPPEVGFRGEQELMLTGNDEAPAQGNSGPQHPAFQKTKTL